MKLKILSIVLIAIGISSCSPVRFNVNEDDPPNPCEGDACYPPPDGVSVWRVGDWGLCSQACNGGTQSREVVCVNKDNVVVPEERCAEAKPNSIQSCNTQLCPGPNPTWNVGAWGACSVSCGDGLQTRLVECRDASGVVADSACTDPKPATQQACHKDCACTPVDKTFNLTVPPGNNKVDLLVVVDDSSSMAVDNLKLADRLHGFVTDLQSVNLDWQMCITTTDVGYYEGRPIIWSNTSTRIVNKTTPNLSGVFRQTIHDIGSGYGNDEQGIKASIQSILNNPIYPCYRTNAAHAVIIVSDEDERSVGGDSSLSSQQYKVLGALNQPTAFVSIIKSVFGMAKRVTVNSIVVRDSVCKQKQDPQGSPSFIGKKYMELSNLTSGTIGNICDEDYSTNLKYFRDAIVSTVSDVKLACIPSAAPIVTLPVGYTWTLNGDKMSFTPALAEGVTLSISYKCCP